MLLTLSVSTFFLLAPDEGPDRFKDYQCPHCKEKIVIDTWELPPDRQADNYFLLVYQPLFVDTWMWFWGIYFTNMAMSFIIYRQENDYPKAALVYFLIWVVDAIFFILTYTDPFGGIKITWNIAKVLIFGYAITQDAKQ